MPAWVIPAAIAGANLIGQGIGAMSQGSINKKTQRWNEHMYDRQRGDALSDWNMMNLYNSPKAQMERFKDAKLNPNLIYGQMSETSPVRSSNVPSWNPQGIKMDVGEAASAGLQAYQSIEMRDAQIDNVQAATAVAKQDALVRAVQVAEIVARTAGTKASTAMSSFQLDQGKRLADSAVDAAKLAVDRARQDLQAGQLGMQLTEQQIKKVEADTKFTLNQDERAALLNAQSLREGVERILLMREQNAKTQTEREEVRSRIFKLSQDQELQQMEIERQKSGGSINDPYYIRKIDALIKKVFNNYLR